MGSFSAFAFYSQPQKKKACLNYKMPISDRGTFVVSRGFCHKVQTNMIDNYFGLDLYT
jgi:hypothetical protein